MDTFAQRQIKRNAQREEQIKNDGREDYENDNTTYYEDDLHEGIDDYSPPQTPKKYETYPNKTKEPKYYEDYLLDDDNYNPLEKDNAKYSAELEQILSDQKNEPLRRAVEKKSDTLYDDLQQQVAKFKSDADNKSYLKEGGKKKKKSSRRHCRTKRKIPSHKRRRVSHKRNRRSHRK